MGTRTADQQPMAWQGSLGDLRRYGTQVAQTCNRGDCRRWVNLKVCDLIEEFGEEFRLWDRRPPCGVCGGKTHYMASPGPATPYRPLLSGLIADEAKREFLKSFGFTARDIRRIKAMAETVTEEHEPAALADLDVPFRVGACRAGHEGYSSGRILGEWAGRSLLYWEMNNREEEVWRRNRRLGPKAVPSGPQR